MHVKFHCVVNAVEVKHIEKISHVLFGNSVVAPYRVNIYALDVAFMI